MCPGTQSCVRSWVATLSLAAMVACAGVPTAPDTKAVSAFALGTTELTRGIDAAVDATTRLDARAIELEGARDYLAGAPPHLDDARPAVPAGAREANGALLAALSAYAERLADLADGSEAEISGEAAALLAGRLVGLTAAARLPKQTTEQGIEAASTLASALAEAWVGRTVAEIAAELDPTIRAAVGALDTQLSEVSAVAADAAHELRFNREQILIELRDQSTQDGADLLAAYDAALRENELAEVNVALADARAALGQLVTAHAALAHPDPADAAAQAARLVALARKIAPLVKTAS